MKKLLLVAAGFVFAASAFAQPVHHEDGPPHHMVPHHKHKVWIPAHGEHGHRVPGHYVWR